MAMSKRQLAQVEADYAGYIPAGKVISVRERREGWGRTHERCDLCNHGYPDKHIVIENATRSLLPHLRHVRVLVCRNGVACRRRAAASTARLAA